MQTPLEKMTELLPKLKGANLRLARWYLDIAGKAVPLPLDHDSNDVAEAVGVSRATVIRFARALGYSGFPAFRHALLQSTALMHNPQGSDQNTKAPLAHILSRYTDAISLSLQMIDPTMFAQAADWLASAPSILWVGWGDSYFAAASAEHKCHVGGLPARSANDVADLGLYLDPLPPGSVAIAISQSGQWQPIADALNRARKQGVHVISVTGCTGSVLAQVADLAFTTANPSIGVGDRLITLRPAQHGLLDALVIEAIRKKGRYAVELPEEDRTQGLPS